MKLLRLAPIALLIFAAACGSPPGQSASTPPPATKGGGQQPCCDADADAGVRDRPDLGRLGNGGRVLTVRAGTHAGYDCFVVEFNSSVPPYEVRTQDELAFVLSPRGESVTLDGSAGVLIWLDPALDWT